MNDNDLNNLYFLLTSPESIIEKWYHAMKPDDHDYAVELLNHYAEVLAQLDHELAEESTELMMGTYETEFPEAKMVLDRIMKMSV